MAGVQVLDSKILMSSESAWVAAQQGFAASVMMTTHGLKSATAWMYMIYARCHAFVSAIVGISIGGESICDAGAGAGECADHLVPAEDRETPESEH